MGGGGGDGWFNSVAVCGNKLERRKNASFLVSSSLQSKSHVVG